MSTTHNLLMQVQDYLAQQTPINPSIDFNPPAEAPPGPLESAAKTMLAWMKWGGLFGAVGAGVASGIMMAVGGRNRNNMAVDGAMRIPWIIGGMALVFGAASIVGFLAK